ncbi:MAG TPA: hypothetical protein VJ890_22360 [Vineibacter sp.]|nr:hypothetical protein [Vineibacter sp.]
MRRLVIACLLAALAVPANAQRPAPTPAPAQPQPHSLDIQAKRPLPTGKYAVDLDTDSALGRDLRRVVMEKLAARGNQVGFSGGHVMKLQVGLTQHFSSSQQPAGAPPRSEIGPTGDRSDIRPPMPDRPVRDMASRPDAALETLNLTLTVRAATTGEVIWAAYATCSFRDGRAQAMGRTMLDAIFADPNRSRRGDAKCPA